MQVGVISSLGHGLLMDLTHPTTPQLVPSLKESSVARRMAALILYTPSTDGSHCTVIYKGIVSFLFAILCMTVF